MGQSLTKVYVHIVFSTRNRQKIIDEQIEDSLFEYIGGICKELKCYPVKVGGYLDHIHILCILSKHIAHVKLVETIKKQSSKWVKLKGQKYVNFYWQSGYAIFSINYNRIDIVERYILNQKKHHQQNSFKNELLEHLKDNDMDYNEEYLWT